MLNAISKYSFLFNTSIELKNNPSEINFTNLKHFSFFFHLLQKNTKLPQNIIFISESLEQAEELSLYLSKYSEKEILLFPFFEHSLYSKFLPSESDLLLKFRILSKLVNNEIDDKIIIFSIESFLEFLPPVSFFKQFFKISKDDIISPHNLAKELIKLGYKSSSSILDDGVGTFSIKGEIFDIYPIDKNPIRLHYFDDLIETIFEIDSSNGKTIKNEELAEISLTITPYVFTNTPYTKNFRANIPLPQTKFKARFHNRNKTLLNLTNNILFNEYPNFLPFFFEQSDHSSFFDFINPLNSIILFINRQHFLPNLKNIYSKHEVDFNRLSEDSDNDCLLPAPSIIFRNIDKFTEIINKSSIHKLEINFSSYNLNINQSLNFLTLSEFLKKYIQFSETDAFKRSNFQFLAKKDISNKDHFDIGDSLLQIQYILQTLVSLSFSEFKVLIFYTSINSKNEIEFLLQSILSEFTVSFNIQFIEEYLPEGFVSEDDKTIFLSECDFFKDKARTYNRQKDKSSKVNSDLFAEQLTSLKIGDFIVHQQFGVGIYKGLININDPLNQDSTVRTNDFLEIHYDSGDKIFVPVYKMNLIQKYADSENKVSLANLRSNKFEKAKEKARSSAKELAFDLLKLQARRVSLDAFAFSPPNHLYNEFELTFPYQETLDQTKAIEDVLLDMEKKFPMDRLICGDVGHGKTEVAMRAAFKAVIDNKQVAILVPTTILALQHYHSFSERFKPFPVTIEFISRLKSPSEIKQLYKNIEEGKVDILIGTHGILNKEIHFKDLGLIIIDEEQRFGVAHKEKLKLIKETVDTLTLSATPIPRTLQMSYLGLKDLSLIQTPPPRRQAIKTILIKQDDHTIKEAIEFEIKRGGQIFYVHNRIEDIDEICLYLAKLSPLAQIVVAHGQLPSKELEKRMNDFYKKKYNILLSTTIIESGIDIPNANTLIIDRADLYGLSQLHQLRGRIGRSDRKSYAYFVIPSEEKLSTIASKRLEAIQKYADLGSGLALASCDLEIRGAGDLLGASQSGHIENIGLELYMELLQEAILEIKGEKSRTKEIGEIEIQLPFPASIPATYIVDQGFRLKFYKKISNATSLAYLDDLKNEITDTYGVFPQEIDNLFQILEIRQTLANLSINFLSLNRNELFVKFQVAALDQNNIFKENLITFFLKHPKQYRLHPDYSVTIKKMGGNYSLNEIKAFFNLLSQQIATC